MVALGRVGKQVKGGVMVGPEEIVGVTTLRPNNIGTLNWVTAEEDGLALCQWIVTIGKLLQTYPVQPDNVVVAFASVELRRYQLQIERQELKVSTLIAKPLGLRAVSGNSRPTVTVEKRMNRGVLRPTAPRKFALGDD